MNTLNYEYHLKVNIDAAWNLWSNFQEIDRFSPAKITGGTNTDEIGAVRIYEIDGSVFVERLENKEDILKKDEILINVWGITERINTHTLETHIYSLKKKLDAFEYNHSFICSDNFGGYYFNKLMK